MVRSTLRRVKWLELTTWVVEPVYRLAEGEWKAFVEEFTDLLVEVDPQIPHLPPKDVIHRIYRDVCDVTVHAGPRYLLRAHRFASATTKRRTRQDSPRVSREAGARVYLLLVSLVLALVTLDRLIEHCSQQTMCMLRLSPTLYELHLTMGRTWSVCTVLVSLLAENATSLLTNRILVKAGGESLIAAGSWCPGNNELQTIR